MKLKQAFAKVVSNSVVFLKKSRNFVGIALLEIGGWDFPQGEAPRKRTARNPLCGLFVLFMII